MKKVKVFGLLVLVSLFLSTEIQAQNWWKSGIKGEGPVVTRDLNVGKFTGVSLGFSGDVYLTQGSSQSVKVEGQANIIDNIKINFNRFFSRFSCLR